MSDEIKFPGRSQMIEELAERWVASLTIEEVVQAGQSGNITHIKACFFNRKTLELQDLSAPTLEGMYKGEFL
jgi:hypothetical protein